MLTRNAAQAWFVDVAERFGQELEDGRVLIPHSQRALAREYSLSPGTVHQYRKALGDNVEVRAGHLVFKLPNDNGLDPGHPESGALLEQLAQAWGQLRPDGTTVLVDDQGKPAQLGELAQSAGVHRNTLRRQIEVWIARGDLRRLGRYLCVANNARADSPASDPPELQEGPTADGDQITTILEHLSFGAARLSDCAPPELLPQVTDLLTTLAELTRSLGASARPRGANGAEARDRAVQMVQDRAEIARPEKTTSSLIKVSKNSYLLEERAKDPVQMHSDAARAAPRSPLSTDDEIRAAVASLAEFCKAEGARDTLDNRGLQLLRPYAPEAIRRAAEAVRKDAIARKNGSKPIKAPFGLLVSKADSDPAFFAMPAAASVEPVAVATASTPAVEEDDELLAELDAMTDAELSVLDSELRLKPGRQYAASALNGFRVQRLRARREERQQQERAAS